MSTQASHNSWQLTPTIQISGNIVEEEEERMQDVVDGKENYELLNFAYGMVTRTNCG